MALPPVMIYGDDVSHIVTEEGVAYLYKANSLDERRAAIAAVAGATPTGLRHDPEVTERLRRDGVVAFPEDLGVDVRRADRTLLAAKSIGDLEAWSGGLYDSPARFRNF
ncbi:hypothetical protein GCM10025867_07980 [Frondihabitans sucicola]|uniref:Malonate decarboxylase subunit alpha n=1 Tax=Frondihabitans sucicola TaxID=1268041 RepID=A0ABM8GJK7_9MICO|nr:hypothetical protein GCM10025867_07980 [Frondihabitans sucicola]